MRAPARFLMLLIALFALVWGATAHAAFTPPPLNGHVVDTAGVLTPEEVLRLDRKLDRVRKANGFAIVVYTLPSLPDGMTIEDVGYTVGNTWKVGSEKGDDGVILIASTGDRKLRIETGKGTGGALTDLESSRINREVIGPLMKQGLYYDAMNRGTDAIVHELVANTEGGKSEDGRGPARRGTPPPKTASDYVKLGAMALGVLLVIILAIVSPTFREILFWILLFGRFGGGGGGGGRGGGGGGSGYGGGGGSFGGGGSSDDY